MMKKQLKVYVKPKTKEELEIIASNFELNLSETIEYLINKEFRDRVSIANFIKFKYKENSKHDSI